MNGFGPAHIEKSHFNGIFGCIFRQSLMKYGGNKSIKENRKDITNFRYSNQKIITLGEGLKKSFEL
jgi:hypothetical protein